MGLSIYNYLTGILNITIIFQVDSEEDQGSLLWRGIIYDREERRREGFFLELAARAEFALSAKQTLKPEREREFEDERERRIRWISLCWSPWLDSHQQASSRAITACSSCSSSSVPPTTHELRALEMRSLPPHLTSS